MNAFEEKALRGPLVQELFELLVRYRTGFNDFISHSQYYSKAQLFYQYYLCARGMTSTFSRRPHSRSLRNRQRAALKFLLLFTVTGNIIGHADKEKKCPDRSRPY
jgi:hypothetical protein